MKRSGEELVLIILHICKRRAGNRSFAADAILMLSTILRHDGTTTEREREREREQKFDIRISNTLLVLNIGIRSEVNSSILSPATKEMVINSNTKLCSCARMMRSLSMRCIDIREAIHSTHLSI
ncbi:hypothetical protein SFRURICE_014581 [Spodoptera frugiperda]|nr:hypothetical protein SFRURICE_014581 [Spodoptera frugiperda]